MNQSAEPTAEKPKRPRWRRILKRVVITLIILVVILLFGVIPWGLAALVTSAGTRPMDRGLTETPATFGFQFKDIEFQTSDRVRISGWLVPARGKHTTIIYSHGLFRSRRELLEGASGRGVAEGLVRGVALPESYAQARARRIQSPHADGRRDADTSEGPGRIPLRTSGRTDVLDDPAARPDRRLQLRGAS